ncbi:SIR2 family protein [Nonomuraea sp. NPDC005983]|uniref:SIR2 family NAD-dependent protein deacylase n=1 Tax=Nonomuraea sp. NPDC005983 TaxID=3155595 RepID=UPI0033BF606E
MTQYAASVGEQDSVDLKHEICTYLKQYVAKPEAAPDPHEILAEFPISTFLTTNYDNFMLQALNRAQGGQKSPRASTSTWWDGNADEPRILDPTPDEPLVYHLHGSWDDPASLVLTEDDYLNYLVNMVDWQASQSRRPLPTCVLGAMTASPLLFVGYSLQDWNFRVLFHGLIRAIPPNMKRRHVSVQLMPDLDGKVPDAQAKAQHYMERYLDGWNISIFIGTTEDFFRELLDRM